uniref:PH domain-containing protein DDB_G0287875-like n=1 Tax=Pristiophorus japonicus TaxID=55135 RepID=UPI00398F8A0C
MIYRQPIRNEELYKIDYKRKLKGCATAGDVDEMETALLDEAQRHREKIGLRKSLGREKLVKSYAEKRRDAISTQQKCMAIGKLRAKYVAKYEAEEEMRTAREGEEGFNSLFDRPSKPEILRKAFDAACAEYEKDEPKLLFSPEFFEFAKDEIDPRVWSPEKYMKRPPKTEEDGRKAMLAYQGKPKQEELEEKMKKQKRETCTRQPTLPPKRRKRRKQEPLVVKNLTDKEMACYFVKNKPTLRERYPPKQPEVVKKKLPYYTNFPRAITPPPAVQPTLEMLQQSMYPMFRPVPANLPPPMIPIQAPPVCPVPKPQPKAIQYPKPRLEYQPPIMPERERTPGPLAEPLPDSLPCALEPTGVKLPYTIPPEYLQPPYLSQEQRDIYNRRLDQQRLNFDFTNLQTQQQVHNFWDRIEKQTLRAQQRPEKIAKLERMRGEYEVLIAQEQVEIQRLMDGMKCREKTAEEREELENDLKDMDEIHRKTKKDLERIMEQLVQFAEEDEERHRRMRQQQENQSALKADTRRAGDDQLPSGFNLQPAPVAKRHRITNRPDPVQPGVAFTVPLCNLTQHGRQ